MEFIEGLPQDFWKNIQEWDNQHVLVVIDDQMNSLNQDIFNMFTMNIHHNNVTVILILHNIFHRGKYVRDISLNAHYIVLFKNPRDSLQVTRLGSQIFPLHGPYFKEAFYKATKNPYCSLLIDLRVSTPENLRLRGNYLDDYPTVYFPKNCK